MNIEEVPRRDMHIACKALSPEEIGQVLPVLESFFSTNIQAKSADFALESVTSNVGIAVQLIRSGAPVVKLAPPSKEFSHETIIVESRSNRTCIDFKGDAIIGCAVLENDGRGGEDAWYVGWIGTLPEFRDQGINTERLRRVRLYAKEKGLKAGSGRSFESDFARASWERLVEEGLAIKVEGQDRYTFQ